MGSQRDSSILNLLEPMLYYSLSMSVYKKKRKTGWKRRFLVAQQIQCCHLCSLDLCCGVNSIPGLGISTCHRCSGGGGGGEKRPCLKGNVIFFLVPWKIITLQSWRWQTLCLLVYFCHDALPFFVLLLFLHISLELENSYNTGDP